MGQKTRAGSAALDRPGRKWRLDDLIAIRTQAMRGRTIRFTTKRPGMYSSSSVFGGKTIHLDRFLVRLTLGDGSAACRHMDRSHPALSTVS